MIAVALILLAMPVLTFVGYPAVLLAVAAVRRRPRVIHGVVPAEAIVVICAHNEAPRIGAKIGSVVDALACWDGAGRIIVGDDGSTDATGAVVATFADRGVDLVTLPRGGKAAALNRVAPRGGDEILVMTDADPLFDSATIPELLAPFADPAVGAVAGRVVTVRGPARFAGFDRLFRGYESAMRQAESDLFGCVSADGGLYAIRASLMPVVPADVTDDFYVSTAAVAEGYRIAFANGARAYEHSIVGGARNFRRRVRITVRGLTALWSRRALMNPARTGWYAIALLMHKVARRVAPLTLPPLWLLAGMLGSLGSIVWGLVFAGLTMIALVGVFGALAPARLPRILSPVFGVALHLAGLATGAMLFVAGRRYAQWTPQKEAM